MDNTNIRSSFYTVYSQPDISDDSSRSQRSLRLVETVEIQASLQSPLFPTWCRMAIAAGTPCDVAFFFQLCVLERCSPQYFEPMPNLSKTLEGLHTPLVIFLSTIFQLNSLNITVSVYVSGSR